MFEENEALIKSWETKGEQLVDVDSKNTLKKSESSPDRSVGSSRSKQTKPLRSPGVEICPRKVEKLGVDDSDDDDDEYLNNDFMDKATPSISSANSAAYTMMPKKTNTRPSTAPNKTSIIRPSYVASADGIITEAEAKARLKKERAKLLVDQKKKKRAELTKQREDALSAKEKIYRNKEVGLSNKKITTSMKFIRFICMVHVLYNDFCCCRRLLQLVNVC